MKFLILTAAASAVLISAAAPSASWAADDNSWYVRGDAGATFSGRIDGANGPRSDNGWTIGALASQVWSFAGKQDREDVSSTFLQPFVAYTTKDAWTFNLDSESTYDWTAHQWTVPFNATVSKLFRIGKQPISMGVAARYYADSPSSGPHGWGARFVVTLLFPE